MEKTFHIQWHITDSCNLRCRHCYQSSFSEKNDLPIEKLISVFSNICEFLKINNKKLVIDITGGEVFLHNDWKELIDEILNSNITASIGIITNGFFLEDEIIKKIERNKILLKVSAEGVEKEVYEFFRGKNYGKFIDVCEKIKGIRTKKFLMFTILERNWKEVFKIFDFAEKYFFDGVIIERFIPYGLGEKIREEIITFESWISVVRYLHKICGYNFDISDIVEYRGFMVEIKNNEYELFGSECIVGKDGCAIMPDGTVYPCRRFPLPIGNLLKESFIEIWENSEILKSLRSKKLLKGYCKNCFIDNCIGCRALVYSLYGDYMKEDPLCFLNVEKGGRNEV